MTRPIGLKEPEKYIIQKKGKSPRFKAGNPGRPQGSLNKVTLLKNKILDAAMSLDLNGKTVRFTKKGRKFFVREVPATDIMKTAATFVPKELKGEGFAGKHFTLVFPGFKKGPKNGPAARASKNTSLHTPT